MNPFPSLSKTRKASRISSSTSESLNSLGKRKTVNLKWSKPYLNILFSDLVISQTNSWKLMSPSPSWSRREGMIKYCKCLILTLGHFKPPTWSITLTMSFSSSSEGDHPKLVITWLTQIDKKSDCSKKIVLRWLIIMTRKTNTKERHNTRKKREEKKKYKTQIFCVKLKDRQLTKKKRLCMKYKIYWRRLENTKYKYFAWNTKPVQAPQLLLILLHPWKYGSLRFSAVRSIL